MRTLSLQDYPQKLEPDELAVLLKKVRENDNAAIETMILHHVRLVILIVNKYIATYHCWYLGDDLDSAALTGLVTAVNNVAAGRMADHDNIGGYIVDYVNNALSNCIRHNSTVYFPKEAERKNIISLSKKLKFFFRDADDYVALDKRCSEKNTFNMLELEEELNVVTTNTLEREILELRRKRYNDSEISTRLGLSRLVVLRIRSKLKTRFQKREKND